MIKLTEENIDPTMSVVLTKIEDPDIVDDIVSERIEEMMELNEDVGELLNAVKEANHFYNFENREHQVQEGVEMLERILEMPALELNAALRARLQERMRAVENSEIWRKEIVRESGSEY
jgi:hypothetical protein